MMSDIIRIKNEFNEKQISIINKIIFQINKNEKKENQLIINKIKELIINLTDDISKERTINSEIKEYSFEGINFFLKEIKQKKDILIIFLNSFLINTTIKDKDKLELFYKVNDKLDEELFPVINLHIYDSVIFKELDNYKKVNDYLIKYSNSKTFDKKTSDFLYILNKIYANCYLLFREKNKIKINNEIEYENLIGFSKDLFLNFLKYLNTKKNISKEDWKILDNIIEIDKKITEESKNNNLNSILESDYNILLFDENGFINKNIPENILDKIKNLLEIKRDFFKDKSNSIEENKLNMILFNYFSIPENIDKSVLIDCKDKNLIIKFCSNENNFKSEKMLSLFKEIMKNKYTEREQEINYTLFSGLINFTNFRDTKHLENLFGEKEVSKVKEEDLLFLSEISKFHLNFNFDIMKTIIDNELISKEYELCLFLKRDFEEKDIINLYHIMEDIFYNNDKTDKSLNLKLVIGMNFLNNPYLFEKLKEYDFNRYKRTLIEIYKSISFETNSLELLVKDAEYNIFKYIKNDFNFNFNFNQTNENTLINLLHLIKTFQEFVNKDLLLLKDLEEHILLKGLNSIIDYPIDTKIKTIDLEKKYAFLKKLEEPESTAKLSNKFYIEETNRLVESIIKYNSITPHNLKEIENIIQNIDIEEEQKIKILEEIKKNKTLKMNF